MPLVARTLRPLPGAAPPVLAVALVCWLTAHASAVEICPGEGCAWVRRQDSVALISSRPVGCSTTPESLEEGLYAERFVDLDGDGDREWNQAPWRSVLAGHTPETPVIIYTHGNRMTWRQTRDRGLYVYNRLLGCSADERPVHFVIWSWCSDQVGKRLRDYRIKAARTEPVGRQLGWVVSQMPAENRLGFMGYSYGARVTSGALNTLACIEGPPRQVRAFYVAAAYDSDWLAEGRRHGDAMRVTQKLLLTANRKDPAMRFYRFLPKGYRPQAMGYAGPTGLPRDRASRVRMVKVTERVGKTHSLCDYVDTPGLMAKACRLLAYGDQVGLALRQPALVGGR